MWCKALPAQSEKQPACSVNYSTQGPKENEPGMEDADTGRSIDESETEGEAGRRMVVVIDVV